MRREAVAARSLAGTLWLIGLLPALARASEEGGGHGHEGIPWWTLLFNLINFLIFCWIIVRFAMPVVREYVRTRHGRVVEQLNAAATARAEAELLRTQWEQRLAALDDEIKQIRSQAAADAARERDQILAAARKTAEAIRNDARRTATQEVRRAEAELRQAVAREAVAVATQLVRDRLTPADQERFVAEFLGEVRQ